MHNERLDLGGRLALRKEGQLYVEDEWESAKDEDIFFINSAEKIEGDEIYMTKKKGSDEIMEHQIRPEDWPSWDEADGVESEGVLSTGAIRPLSLAESATVRSSLDRQGKLDRILPSRYVRRMQPADLAGQAPTYKSRWCVRGDKDPDLLSLVRAAPTVTTSSLMVVLQIAASLKMPGTTGDLWKACSRTSCSVLFMASCTPNNLVADLKA